MPLNIAEGLDISSPNRDAIIKMLTDRKARSTWRRHDPSSKCNMLVDGSYESSPHHHGVYSARVPTESTNLSFKSFSGGVGGEGDNTGGGSKVVFSMNTEPASSTMASTTMPSVTTDESHHFVTKSVCNAVNSGRREISGVSGRMEALSLDADAEEKESSMERRKNHVEQGSKMLSFTDTVFALGYGEDDLTSEPSGQIFSTG